MIQTYLRVKIQLYFRQSGGRQASQGPYAPKQLRPVMATGRKASEKSNRV